MGHEAIIYGRILGARGSVGEHYRTLQGYNRAILDQLPRKDDSWPWLVRGMFALPVGWPLRELSAAGDSLRGFFQR